MKKTPKKSLIQTNDYNAVSTEVKLSKYLISKQSKVEFSYLNTVTSIYYVQIFVWIGSPLTIMVLYSKCISCPK